MRGLLPEGLCLIKCIGGARNEDIPIYSPSISLEILQFRLKLNFSCDLGKQPEIPKAPFIAPKIYKIYSIMSLSAAQLAKCWYLFPVILRKENLKAALYTLKFIFF